MKKGDIILALVILVASGLIFFFPNREPSGIVKAVITLDGVPQRTINLTGLSEKIVLRIEGGQYFNNIEAENGRIRVESANCPDQVCVHSGWLSKPGESAVCLKSRLVIRLVGENGVDAVAS